MAEKDIEATIHFDIGTMVYHKKFGIGQVIEWKIEIVRRGNSFRSATYTNRSYVVSFGDCWKNCRETSLTLFSNNCLCGHPQGKHQFDGYGDCNEFKCVCDRFTRPEYIGLQEMLREEYEKLGLELKTEKQLASEEQPLESAVADDFNSSAASKDGGFLERLG